MFETVSNTVGPGPTGPVAVPAYAAPKDTLLNLSLIS